MVHREIGMTMVNILRPDRIGRHFADDMMKCILLNEIFKFQIKCHWSMFFRVYIINKSALVRAIIIIIIIIIIIVVVVVVVVVVVAITIIIITIICYNLWCKWGNLLPCAYQWQFITDVTPTHEQVWHLVDLHEIKEYITVHLETRLQLITYVKNHANTWSRHSISKSSFISNCLQKMVLIPWGRNKNDYHLADDISKRSSLKENYCIFPN